MSFELLDPEARHLCEGCVLCCSADPCWLRLEITTMLSQQSWAALGKRARNQGTSLLCLLSKSYSPSLPGWYIQVCTQLMSRGDRAQLWTPLTPDTVSVTLSK